MNCSQNKLALRPTCTDSESRIDARARFALNDFLVRQQGFSLDFQRVSLLAHLPLEEQLLFALIRDDEIAVSTLLPVVVRDPGLSGSFRTLARNSGFCGLVLEKLVDKYLDDKYGFVPNNSFSAEIALLSEKARLEPAIYARSERGFTQMLEFVAEHQNKAIWHKGVHLARTVYPKPHFRLYGDIDVIVHPSEHDKFVNTLRRAGFEIFINPAFCDQLGAGPTNRISDLSIAPGMEWVAPSAVTMDRIGSLVVDIKQAPLNRGLQILELERFFDEAQLHQCAGRSYFAPSTTDHLMIMLRNLESDRFAKAKSIYDVSLLAKTIASTPEWEEFVRKCRKESITVAAWAGLAIAVDRLNTPVPPAVLNELQPQGVFKRFSFSVNPSYVWNSTSLPMLVADALLADDRGRKLTVLQRSFVPSKEFLRSYYASSPRLENFPLWTLLVLHWLVLLLPGGVVRRTIGKFIWPAPVEQFASDKPVETAPS